MAILFCSIGLFMYQWHSVLTIEVLHYVYDLVELVSTWQLKEDWNPQAEIMTAAMMPNSTNSYPYHPRFYFMPTVCK